MAVTPYIWLLWNTKTGKVIIILIIIYLVVGIMINMLGWWTLLILALCIAAIVYSWVRDSIRMKKYREKSQKSKEKAAAEWRELRKRHPRTARFWETLTGKNVYYYFWLVIGKAAKRPEYYYNGIFNTRFEIEQDFKGIIMKISNPTGQSLEIDWDSFKVNGRKASAYNDFYETLLPRRATTITIKSDDFKEEIFHQKKMMMNEQRYIVSFNIKEGSSDWRKFDYDLYVQVQKIERMI